MKTLKTMLVTLMLTLGAAVASAQPMSYSAMQNNARFITDRMIYTLGLDPLVIDDLYAINFDYIYGVNDYLDEIAYGNRYNDYLEVCYLRDRALRMLLTDLQWEMLMRYDYFYRPISFSGRRWFFGIYHYDNYRTHFYYSLPGRYHSYRGGHYYGGMRPRQGIHGARSGMNAIVRRGNGGHPGGNVGRPGGNVGGHPGGNAGRPGGIARPGESGTNRPGYSGNSRPEGNGGVNRPEGNNGGMNRPEGNGGAGRPEGNGGGSSATPGRGSYGSSFGSGNSGTTARPTSPRTSGSYNSGSSSTPSRSSYSSSPSTPSRSSYSSSPSTPSRSSYSTPSRSSYSGGGPSRSGGSMGGGPSRSGGRR